MKRLKDIVIERLHINKNSTYGIDSYVNHTLWAHFQNLLNMLGTDNNFDSRFRDLTNNKGDIYWTAFINNDNSKHSWFDDTKYAVHPIKTPYSKLSDTKRTIEKKLNITIEKFHLSEVLLLENNKNIIIFQIQIETKDNYIIYLASANQDKINQTTNQFIQDNWNYYGENDIYKLY